MKILLVLGGLLLTLITPTYAATFDSLICSQAVAPQRLSVYEFAKATLVSLWYARNAASRGTEIQQNKDQVDNWFSFITMMMRVTKTSTDDFMCAKQAIEPFTLGDKNMAIAAKFFAVVYAGQIDLNNRMIVLLKKLETTSQADLMDQMSSFQVERDRLYADLVQPTAIAFGSLVDLKRTDIPNRTTRLIITMAQRHALVEWANHNFVEFTNGTPEKQWTDPAKTARMALDIFKGRKCSDE